MQQTQRKKPIPQKQKVGIVTSLNDTTLTKVKYEKYATQVPDEVAYSPPYNKRIYISSRNMTLPENEVSGGLFGDSRDQVLKALTMTNKIGQQLQQILDRLESMETKLQMMEGVLSQILNSNLEKSVNKIPVSIVSFNKKVKKMDDTIQDLDAE